MIKVILASASPRRRELLEQIEIPFSVVVSDVEEEVTTKIPSQVVEQLSSQKAEAVYDHLTAEAQETTGELLVIGADTIVACGEQILGKPKDPASAVDMLNLLQGREHQVYTGVTVLHRSVDGQRSSKVFHEKTNVFFYPMTAEEIADYVSTKDPLDKAGAYGIQGLCARYIKGIEGDYNNVVGLPVGRLYQEIKEWINL